MKNQKGFAEVAILYGLIAVLAILFIPNPVSSSLGVGIKPNKTVQKVSHTEKIQPVIMVNGKEQPYKTVTDDYVTDDSIQQHVTFLEWLRSLPALVVILMLLGIVFPPVALFLHNLWANLKADTKKIVVGVDKALDKIQDPAIKQVMLAEMDKAQDTSTKVLVNKIQGK